MSQLKDDPSGKPRGGNIGYHIGNVQVWQHPHSYLSGHCLRPWDVQLKGVESRSGRAEGAGQRRQGLHATNAIEHLACRAMQQCAL
jgi:hypothetical protein